jgi:4'-phosphopantetheinyl transferase
VTPRTIDVWQVDTDLGAADLAALSPAERARAAGGGARKQRWAVGRAALRILLSSYLDCAPVGVEFLRGPHGKPSVEGLWFSSSRSGAAALVAVSQDGPVGVDIERVDARRPVRRMAQRLFTGDEATALEMLSPGQATTAFHRCWSAKEAYAKGVGRGLAIGFDTFSVAPIAARGCERVRVKGWEVRSLHVREGYAAALAAPGSAWRCDTRTWTKTS